MNFKVITNMKKFFCLFALIFCLAAPEIFGQAGSLINVRFRLSADTATMTAYPMPPEREKDKSIKTLILKMNYNESGILNSKDAEILNSGLCNVISVDLVYTHDGNEELLETLNKRRLFELYMISPDLLGRTMVKWRFVKQLGDGQNVRNMFHGYVIRYRKIKPYRPLSLASLKEDVMALAAKPFDNDLFKIFRRIKNVEHQAIVVDFTGSMSPYFTQLMAWFFLQKYTVPTSFVFFNDGNDKPDNKKVIGKTGGLYSFRTDNLDTLLFYSLRTVDSGSGGDSPENNVEAVLQAISENPKVEKNNLSSGQLG